VLESTDYDPWGVALPGRTLGSGTKQGFTGKERDAETGLDYFGARSYLPALGRWGSVDPLAELYPAWSPYNYVLNDPNRLTDPDGRHPIWPAAAIGAGIGAGIGIGVELIGQIRRGERLDGTRLLVAGGAGALSGALTLLPGGFGVAAAANAGVSVAAGSAQAAIAGEDYGFADARIDLSVGAASGGIAFRAAGVIRSSSAARPLREAVRKTGNIAARRGARPAQIGRAQQARAALAAFGSGPVAQSTAALLEDIVGDAVQSSAAGPATTTGRKTPPPVQADNTRVNPRR
jgi:RHS repeat-associated protein